MPMLALIWTVTPSMSTISSGRDGGASAGRAAGTLAAESISHLELRSAWSTNVADAVKRCQTAGRADVTIASISVTTDRAKAVMYCHPNGALSIVIFGPQDVAIKTPADLVGKRIGITRATLEEATVPKMAPPGTNIVWFDEIGATIQALLSGQVDAVAMTSFAGKTVADGNPDKKIETKLAVTTAYYAPAPFFPFLGLGYGPWW